MKYTVEIISETEVAMFLWTGIVKIDDRRNNRNEIKSFCQNRNIKHVIVDCREQEDKSSTLEAYLFGSEIPEVMSGFKIALVIPRNDRNFQFMTNVAVNRGGLIDSFYNMDDAHEWLVSQ